MGQSVVGVFTLQREGKLYTPRAVAILEPNIVKVQTLSTPFHYYLIPGFMGAIGFEFFGLMGLAVAVLIGTPLVFFAQKWKHKRQMRKIRDGKKEVSPNMIIKKGKVTKVQLEDARRGKALHIVSKDHDFKLVGDTENLERVQETLF